MLAGYALAWLHPFPPVLESPCRIFAAAAGLASLLAGAGRGNAPGRPWRARGEASLAALALALSGAALAAEADRGARPLPVHPRPIPIEVTARVIETAAATARSPSLLVETRSVRVGGREAAVRARLSLRFRDLEAAPDWAVPGLSLRASGWYRPPEDSRNPGGFAPGRWLERAGLSGAIDVDPASVRLAPSGAGGVNAAPAMIRARIGRAADGALSAPSAALLRGMLLGDRAGIAPAIEDAFRDGGTIHVLSISGLHVCILAGLAAFGCAALRVPVAPATAMELVALWAYVAFVGAPVPAVRSALLWTALRGARIAGRSVRPFTAWGIAGLGIHLADPAAPLDAGFQLSFAAVLGLLAAAGLAPQGEKAPTRGALLARAMRAARSVAGLAAQSAGAEGATLGLQVALFGAVPVAGLLLNLLVVPLCSLFLAQAVVYVAGDLLVPPLAPVFAAGVDATGLGLVAVTRWAAALAPALPVRAIPAPGAIAAAFGLLFLAACTREAGRFGGRGSRARVAVLAAAAFALAAALPLLFPTRAPARRGALGIVALDVGQGDAVYALLPDGRTLLVDAGPRTETRDAGRSTIEPALRVEGVRRIDLAVLSHAHADHYGGFGWLARRGWIAALVENGSPRLGSTRSGLRHAAESRGGRWIPLARDTTIAFGAGAAIELLPAARVSPAGHSANAEENNQSIVAQLRACGRVVLLPGDSEAEAERALAPRIAGADALKASHHGSATSSEPAWIAAARPRVALISCGEGNRFGHPSPVTLGRLVLAGARVYRTDLEGAIRLTADAEGLWVSTWAHPDPERVAGPVEVR